MELNWQQQGGSSLSWLLASFAIAGLVSALLVWALARGTAWGRQFWRLAWPYLTPRRGWRPLASLALQLLLTLAAVRMTVLFSYWYKGFYDARSEEHTSELQSLMRISYAVFCLKKKKKSHHDKENDNTEI